MRFEKRVTLRRAPIAPVSDELGCMWPYAGDAGPEDMCVVRRSTGESFLDALVRIFDFAPTGGSLRSELKYGNLVFVDPTANTTSPSPARPLSVPEALARIRHYFSLTLADLARILRVQRPTVYAWLESTQEPRDGNLKRLHRLSSLVSQWMGRMDQPVGIAGRQPLVGDASLIDLLASENVNEADVQRAFDSIKVSLPPTVAGRPARLRPRGVTAKSTAQQDASVRRTVRKYSRRGKE